MKARRLLLVPLGLGVGLLMVEILLRLVPAWLPLDIRPQIAQKPWLLGSLARPQFLSEYGVLWESDDFLREHIKPGVDTVLHGNPEYPKWHIKTDSLGLGPAGFRDTLPDRQPYAIVLGDSFGFGVGVAQEEAWMEVLERETGLPFVNLSQVGASSLQEARIYSRYGSQIPAPIVFWMYFQNDLKDNLRFAHWLNPEANIVEAVSQPTQTCAGRLHRFLKQYSLAYEFFLYRQRACEYSALPATPIYRDAYFSFEFCRDHDVCNLSVQARMLADGWPLTRQALYDTLAQTDRAGAELILVIVPSKEQVYWEQFQQVASLPPDYSIDRLVEPVREFCTLEELRCIDLTDAFRARAKEGVQLYFPVDIHWNAQGHLLAATAIGEYLSDAGLLP